MSFENLFMFVGVFVVLFLMLGFGIVVMIV